MFVFEGMNMLKTKNHDGAIDCHGITGISVTRMNIHFYLIDDILIDTGSALLGRSSIPFFRNNPIKAAALTHVHEDHSGMAAWLKNKLEIPVYLHEGDHAEAVYPVPLPLYRRLVWGKRKPFHATPFPECLKTENYKLDVIPSPGHSSNHVVFHEKNKGWLFTGDLYIGPRQYVAFHTENTLETIKSIKLLLELDWDTIFCSHSGVKTNGKERLKRKLDYLESISYQVKKLHNNGLTMEEINKYIFPKKNLWEFVSRGEWSSYRLVSTAI